MNRRLRLPDGGELAYETRGKGPPLLLVSGLGGLASFWRGFADRCAEHFTVVLHDHRGCGLSSRCDRDYSIDTMADDVSALMDHLGLDRAACVGHSTGGAIAQALALRPGSRLERIVLSATFARPCPYLRRLFRSRLELLTLGGMRSYREHAVLLLNPPYWIAEHDEQIERSLADYVEHPLDAALTRRRIGAVLAQDTADRLGGIACRSLVVAARDDVVVPAYHSEMLAREIPDATLAILPRGGHYVPIAEPDRYAAAVLGFLLDR